MDNSKYAVSVLIKSPKGIPLVWDPRKKNPYWKLPGGRSEKDEFPATTAIREIKEETGLIIKEKDLQLIYKEDRDNHFFVLFKTKLPSLSGLKAIGNEMEQVKIFSVQKIKTLKNFFLNHRKILEHLQEI
jgi:8-oxo-dGTP diphosphatase